MTRRLAPAAVVALLLLIAAAPAGAASGTYDCDHLQDGFSQVQAGDTITLQGICTGLEYDLHGFPTPSDFPNNYAMWTFRGDPGDGVDGFDGTGLTGAQRMLTGVDVHRLEIQDLLFRDGNVTGDGGAINLTGESALGLRRSAFFNNHATGKGGAVHVAQGTPFGASILGGVGMSENTFGSESNAGEGNSAATGGAVAIELQTNPNNGSGINGSTFANNTASGNGGAFSFQVTGPPDTSTNFSLTGNVVVKNNAGGSGGGGYVAGLLGFLDVDQDRYENNSVEPVGIPPASDHFGGGLYLEGGLPDLGHNVFRGNAVKTFANGHDYGGGGLAIFADGVTVRTQHTRVESNTVAGQPNGSTGFDSEGGGVYLSDPDGTWRAFVDDIAGNTVGDFGEGGGIYVGASAVEPTTVDLGEVTVAGNTVGANGSTPGIRGNGSDILKMHNSIVFHSSQPDISGFDPALFDISYSDACNNDSAFPGTGNICADPKLVGGADVRQTSQSPTIDKGNDALWTADFSDRFSDTDFEGDPKPTDGDGDGHTVDMGADESPAFVAQQQPPPPAHVPQCSDGADNDGDGAIDSADPGCLAGPNDDNEGDETPSDLVLCGSRDISLVRADVKGSKVQLSGFVATKFAGQKVTLSVRYLKRAGKAEKLGAVTAAADGSFKGSVKRPKRKAFTFARYRAQVGTSKSVELKLPQSLASSSLKRAAGGMLELRGQVDRELLGKRNAVVVKRILCGKYSTVSQAKPDKKGKYVVRFPAPASGGSALYRAETKVLARPGSKRYVKQFARAIGITF
ncbi:MAG: hypothetical protein QOI32_539 [Thermoleophilaceae bacterium]|jgi:hypothetical protein|nr:hypothetical protein [Thermoleophilaceae bacterium]